jgi:transposase
MSRSLLVRRPPGRELRRLQALLEEETLSVQHRRRADAVLLHGAGLTAQAIAAVLGAHANTVYADLHAFAAHGLACVTAPRPGGAPRRITAEQRATILALADRAPTEVGLPEGRWSLASLRAYLLAHRIVRAISREHLRRVLKKGGTTSGALGASSSAATRSGRPSSAASAWRGATAARTR